ncbi:hypothetical protein SynA1528_02284 [Synechococcus sp. A15-28]|nr:hypothetical protein SynA1528_02284 [Synechococcus sp. A15-28]
MDPIQLCIHIADQPTGHASHSCADRSGNRSILHLRTAKLSDGAKVTREESCHR